MPVPADIHEIYLQPGDVCFAEGATRMRTLLGSCISITLWHPRRRLGGMCHFMLPQRPNGNGPLHGRFADEAMEMLAQKVASHKTVLAEYDVKLFGGANMFPEFTSRFSPNIAQNNIDAAYALLARYQLRPRTTDVGLSGPRVLIFEVWSGSVWVRYQPLARQPG